jgi:hypothetical protein
MEEERLNALNKMSEKLSGLNGRTIGRSETLDVLIDATCNMFGGPDKVAEVLDSHYKNCYDRVDGRSGREMPGKKERFRQ